VRTILLAAAALTLVGCGGGPNDAERAAAEAWRRSLLAVDSGLDCADAVRPGSPVALPVDGWCLDLGTPTRLATLTVPCPTGGTLHVTEYGAWRPDVGIVASGYPLGGLTADYVAAACTVR
jgi:hypothetical protein